MGSQNSNPQQLGTNRKFVNDPHYGGNVILSELTHTVFQQFILEEKHLPPFLKLVEQRRRLCHPHLLTIKSQFSRTLKPDSICSADSRHQVIIEYSYLRRTLEDIIEEYSSKGLELPEAELLKIFGAVVETLKYLKEAKTCHGDLKAGNILFDSMGVVKVIDSYFVNGGKTAYEIVMQNPSSMSLLAPEQLGRIRNRQFEDISTIHASQMFAVGLTMIEAMTFEPAMECYDLQKLQIKENFGARKVQELRSTSYSPKTVALVLGCIAQERQQRPTFQQFLAAVRTK